MSFKILAFLALVITIASVFVIGANVSFNTGKLVSFDGRDFIFTLAGTNATVVIPFGKISKVSFDNKTENGTGLIMKNGVNLPYAKISVIRDDKAFFTLPFGELEANLSDIAFINFKNIMVLSSPSSFNFIVHPSVGGNFTAKLISVKKNAYKFQTSYGVLSIPWSQIKDIEKVGALPIKSGILLYGNVLTEGNVSSFDGKYYTITTSYGKYKIVNGSIIALANERPTEKVNFGSFLILKDGQVLEGNIVDSKSGSMIYQTPWGKVKIPMDSIISVQMRKFAGVRIVTKPSGVDVQLDGVKLGKTPLKLPLTLKGEHVLTLAKPRYQILMKKICALPYAHLTLSYKLSYGNVWQKDGEMPTARGYLSAVEYEGKIYVMGGYDNNTQLDLVEVYDPKTNKWSTASPMLTPRDEFAAVKCNGMIYAIGGWNGSRLNSVEVYDPQMDTWSAINSMPTARNRLAAVEYNGKIYAIGGYADDEELGTVELYDPEKGVWNEVSPMPTPRDGFAAVRLGEKIYTIGGANENDEALNTVEIYDPEMDTWTEGTPMPTARLGLTAVEYAGKIYAIGGEDTDGESLNIVEIYDPKNDEWSEANSPMPTARRWMGGAEYDGKIYIFGGENDEYEVLNMVEDYVPGEASKNENSEEEGSDFSAVLF